MSRFRTYRSSQAVRDQHAEVHVGPEHLIVPYFVVEGHNRREAIASLHGVDRFSIDQLLIDLNDTVALGLSKIILFGVISEDQKDELATQAYAPNNLIERAVAAVKQAFPQLTVFTDVCLCGYASHGHCGLVKGTEIDNDSTLPLLGAMAVSHARGGADFVAPSAMMDFQVAAIRQALDEAGFTQTKILSYSAKYASGFYGPFRDAAQSAPSFGDRRTYQMDYRTQWQPVAEVGADLTEGADWVMVKPAHTYLDIIQRIRVAYPNTPLAAYHVSGEYMMIKAAAAAGFMDEQRAMTEAIYAIRRAGADTIITYYAKQLLRNRD